VCAKDMMLHMIARFGMNGGQYQAVEFAGEAVMALGMQERMTLSNMSAEMGAQVGLIAPDDTTRQWLAATGEPAAQALDLAGCAGDEGAAATTHVFDAATLAPQVAAPHSPANTRAVGEFGQVRVDVAYIGACTGAKLDDLRAAAQVFKGAAPGVSALRVDAARHGRAQAHGFVFFQGVQVVQAAQKQQVGDLLHHLQGVGDATGPERVPDGVNLAAQFASEHEVRPLVVISAIFS
jgi:3-isopropylmalate/(R)-2-methylmalate dehydratase large subunit